MPSLDARVSDMLVRAELERINAYCKAKSDVLSELYKRRLKLVEEMAGRGELKSTLIAPDGAEDAAN